MVVRIPVRCNGIVLEATLALDRTGNIVTSQLIPTLQPVQRKDRHLIEDEVFQALYLCSHKVELTLEAGGKEFSITATVMRMSASLVLGTDVMHSLGIRLMWKSAHLTLPREHKFTRDWVLEVFRGIESRIHVGPQRGIPTCGLCNRKGHLRFRCRQKDGGERSEVVPVTPPSTPEQQVPEDLGHVHKKRRIAGPSNEPLVPEGECHESEEAGS